MKGPHQESERITHRSKCSMSFHNPDESLAFQIKNYYNNTIKKIHNPLKNGQRIWTDISPKMMAHKHTHNAQYL